MAIAFVQYDDRYINAASGTIANDTALNTTSGNLLVVVIGAWDGTPDACIVTGVADTAGNTYIKVLGQYRDGTNTERLEIWYAKNITGNASNTTTATFTDTAGFRYISVSEFSGAGTDAPLDDSSYNSESTTTSHSSGNATASVTGALIVGGYNAFNRYNVTVGSGFTTLASDLTTVYEIAQYKILDAAGDYDSNCTSASATPSINVCAIFKPAAGVTPTAAARIFWDKDTRSGGFTMASKDHMPIEPHHEIHLSEQNNAFRGSKEDSWMRGKEQGPMEYDVNDPLQPLMPSVKRNKNNKLAMHLENLKNERTLVQ